MCVMCSCFLFALVLRLFLHSVLFCYFVIHTWYIVVQQSCFECRALAPASHSPGSQTTPSPPPTSRSRLRNFETPLRVCVVSCWLFHWCCCFCCCCRCVGGQVGVSAKCVMGLNQNHGQKILLRLRTDDLKGFRKVCTI